MHTLCDWRRLPLMPDNLDMPQIMTGWMPTSCRLLLVHHYEYGFQTLLGVMAKTTTTTTTTTAGLKEIIHRADADADAVYRYPLSQKSRASRIPGI